MQQNQTFPSSRWSVEMWRKYSLQQNSSWVLCLQCFDTVGWATEGHLACKKLEWWGVGMIIGLEQGADLHMAQLMPLPLAVSCFSKIQIGFTFLVPAHLGSSWKRVVIGVCVCVCVCVLCEFLVKGWWLIGCWEWDIYWSYQLLPLLFFISLYSCCSVCLYRTSRILHITAAAQYAPTIS